MFDRHSQREKAGDADTEDILTTWDIKNLKRVFALLDVEGTGFVTKENLEKKVSDLGYETEKVIKQQTRRQNFVSHLAFNTVESIWHNRDRTDDMGS